MLFNSYAFIFAFLPITFFVYFYFNRKHYTVAAKYWLLLTSLFFYGWWNINYLPLILSSIVFNFGLSNAFKPSNSKEKNKLLLITGLLFNIGILGVFKYTDFFIQNMNSVFDTSIPFLHFALPLGISFFSLQQITYIVDRYEGLAQEKEFINYAIYVTFFPQLIAGPIVHHSEIMPQLKKISAKVLNKKNITIGLFLFSIGLFKKAVIADTCAIWVNAGFQNAETLSFLEAWITSLSYSLQLYFDFSGYTDMALGIGYMFNIKLPINFNSPYKARNIIDFWQRWHITLSRFITTYLYTPMIRSLNKITFPKAMVATLLAMLIAGLWHGAAWTFILFGFIHGIGLITNHIMRKKKLKKLPHLLACTLTFMYVNMSFTVFRSTSLKQSAYIFKSMLGFNGLTLHPAFSKLQFLHLDWVTFNSDWLFKAGASKTTIIILVILLVTCFIGKNSTEMIKSVPKLSTAIVASILFVVGLFYLSRVSEFLYFNF
ncbi:membrane-bound O-acyltransferase family protein [Candidatus Marinamargulisbacteria bacterium SCGC AAA071-K20]|nr:membrane-bound O-acyltransferase family protein [Candidatus Marinamargulisbacteria bacterium SCGC AAA071-K20]